MNGFSDHF